MTSRHNTKTYLDDVRSSVEPSDQQRHARRELYELQDSELLARQRSVESNARSYPRRLPVALKRGRGVYLEDIEGRIYIDCLAAAGTLALGHNHPRVVEALARAMRSELPMQALDLATPAKDEFVSELLSFLPPEFARRARLQFCGPTGTDAVEAALKLVRTSTGRKGVLAFQGGYHGMSAGALALMGNLGPKAALDGVLQHVQFLPFPYHYRCPFGLGGEAGEKVGLSYIENLLHDAEGGVLPPAGMVLEAVQGEAGVVPAPDAWLHELRRIATAAGVPLIIDEIQTGFGRTGRNFAFEHASIVPDVVVLSKAVGGGLPLALIAYDESLDRWQPGAHAGTFRGNQLGMVAGLETLRVIKEQRLEQHAHELGQYALAQLLGLQRDCTYLGEVRGRGLMIGMEMVDPEGRPDRMGHAPASREVARAVQAACLTRGLIVELGGRSSATVRILPPLVITRAELDVALQIIADAVRHVMAARRARVRRSSSFAATSAE